MRVNRVVILIGLAVLTVGVAFVSQAQNKKERSLKTALGDQVYTRCGLEKLSPDERHELMSLISVGPMPSYAPEAAAHYMEKEGWRRVRVIGAVATKDPFDEYWPVVWDKYELHTLDPFGSPELPDPGIYWAKNSLSSWTILYPDASEVSFTEREVE